MPPRQPGGLDEDLLAAVAACRRQGAPIVQRGAGTSLAGQCCNVAVVIDASRHLTGVREIDPGRRIARVRPGTVLDDRLTIACGDGAVRILELQRAGRQAMNAEDFLRGQSLPRGKRLT